MPFGGVARRIVVAGPAPTPATFRLLTFCAARWPVATNGRDWTGDDDTDLARHPAHDAAERRAIRVRTVEDPSRASIGAGQGQQQPLGQLAPPGARQEP